MVETIAVAFQKKDLPAWAQHYPAVVARCKNNLAFRCDVHSATTRQYRRILISVAEASFGFQKGG